MKARALIGSDVNKVELGEVELPEPGPGEVLVETLYSGVSPGTELRCLAGKQDGVSFPFIPGYSLVGRVIRRGSGATLAEGTVGFMMGSDHSGHVGRGWAAHMSHAVLNAASLLPIPKDVDLVQAAAAKMASIPYHGLRLCRPLPGEKVAVVGLGAIGHMAAKLYTLAGAHTVACDVSASRVELAQNAGMNATLVQGSLKKTFSSFFPEGADAVVDCTGAPALFKESLEVCRDLPWGNHLTPGPRFVVQGSYPADFSVPYGSAFLRELTLLLPRSEQDRDRVMVFDMIARGELSLKSVISDLCKPSAAPKVYAELGKPGTSLLSVVFEWAA